MEKPNVDLKEILFFRGRQGFGLNAEVWIDGIYCMFVIDEANGGCFNYQYQFKIGADNYNKMIKEKIKSLQDYVDALPDVVSEEFKITYKISMDDYINQLVEETEQWCLKFK